MIRWPCPNSTKYDYRKHNALGTSPPPLWLVRQMDDLGFLDRVTPGTVSVQLDVNGTRTTVGLPINPWLLLDKCPKLVDSLIDDGNTLVLPNVSRTAAICFLRWLHLDDYVQDQVDSELFQPVSLLLHLQMYQCGIRWSSAELTYTAKRHVLRETEAGCSFATPIIDLVEAIRTLYMELYSHQDLREYVAYYCVRNFVRHNLHISEEFRQTVYECHAFKRDICRANMHNEFLDTGADEIVRLPVCSHHIHQCNETEGSSFLCHLHTDDNDSSKPVSTRLPPTTRLHVPSSRERLQDTTRAQRADEEPLQNPVPRSESILKPVTEADLAALSDRLRRLAPEGDVQRYPELVSGSNSHSNYVPKRMTTADFDIVSERLRRFALDRRATRRIQQPDLMDWQRRVDFTRLLPQGLATTLDTEVIIPSPDPAQSIRDFSAFPKQKIVIRATGKQGRGELGVVLAPATPTTKTSVRSDDESDWSIISDTTSRGKRAESVWSDDSYQLI